MIYFEIPLAGRSSAPGNNAYTVIKAAGGANANMEFVDATQTLKLKVSWRNIGDLKSISQALYAALQSADPKVGLDKRDAMIDAFGTPAYKKEVANWTAINKARETLRPTADAPKDQPDTSAIDFDAPAADTTKAIMAANQGVCLARAHSDPDSLAAMLKNVQDGDIEMLFLEEFSTHLQDDLDDYLAGDDDALPPPLQARVDELKASFNMDWEPVLQAARQKRARIYSVDNEEARDCPPEAGLFEEHRDSQMNAVVFEVMDAALKDPANAGKKYMAVVGAAHANTHEGGIPGVCQMFGIPAVRVNGSKAQLEPENKALRGMPGKEEQIFIDLALKDRLPKLEAGSGKQGMLDLKAKVLGEAAKARVEGKLVSFEEQVFMDQFMKAARKADPNATDAEIRSAAGERIRALKANGSLAADVDVAALIPPPVQMAQQLAKAHDFAELRKFSTQIDDLREECNQRLEAITKSQQMVEMVDATVPANDTERNDLAGQKQRSLASIQNKQNEIDDLKDEIAQKEAAFALAMSNADATLIAFADDKGRNLLHLAATMESKAGMKAVLDRCGTGALDRADAEGNTALHLCLKERRDMGGADSNGEQADCADYLLGKGADPDLQNAAGSTPAHLVAKTNNTKVLKTLLDADADLSLKDKRGWSALDTTIAATSVEAEKLFYSEGKAQKQRLGDPNKKMTTVELLCAATLCEDPADLVKVKAVYEQMYADPALRPVLKLAGLDAAEPRDPPGKGSRIVVASGKTVSNLYLQPPGYKAPYPSGAYDEKAGVMMTGNRKGEQIQSDALFAGVLVHEMTHLSANIVNQGKPVPYEDGDDDMRDRYVEAIEADAKNLHLMSPTSDVEKRAMDRLCKRLDEYKQRKGEDGLLEECLVGVPQLIAEFGSDAVDKLAPNLSGFFRTSYANKCNEVADSPRFKNARKAVDDTPLATLKPLAHPPLAQDEEYAAKGSPALSVDDILKKIEADYTTHYGARTGTGIAYKTDDFALNGKQKKELAKKLAAVKKALNVSLSDKLMTTPISNEDLRKLIHDTADLTHVKKEGDLEKLITARTNQWLIDAKSNYLNVKLGKGETMSDLEIAESVLLNTEMMAGAGPDYNVNTDKHAKLVQELQRSLATMPPEKKNTQTLQMDLINRMVAATTKGKDSAIHVKTKKKLIGKRDLKHVSVNVRQAKSRWLDTLATIKAS